MTKQTPANGTKSGREKTRAVRRQSDLCTEYSLSCVDREDELRRKIVEISGLSELFRALADDTRTKILYLLSEQELCVCDLAYLLEMSLPAVSHHLRLLRIMRLVRPRRRGKQMFYSLDDDHVVSLILTAQKHFIDQL